MPVLKIANQKTTSNNTAALSSDVSSSVSGNMNLIQYQIGQKSNDYINIKNAVKILEQYSNWNGYIKIYTEIENNFNTGDTVYITYTDPDPLDSNVFNLENPSNFINPFDENVNSNFYVGYKVLYTNKYKNEIVINRYYNDIGDGKLLKNQYLSKISCRGGNFYNDIADGVVFYDCNIFNGEFATITGYVSGQGNSGLTIISGATIICVGLTSISDLNSLYSLNVPTGVNIVKCYATGYITNTFYIDIATNETKYYNILMLSGTNSITISADTTTTTPGYLINFTSSTVGYDEPVNYQWKINNIDVGTNNSTFSYNSFVDGDIVTCEVSDDFGTALSNEIVITIIGTTTTTTSTTTTTLPITGTTTTTTTTLPITFAFNIKYGQYPVDACDGTSAIAYSLIPSPNIGTILYKDAICTQPWDTLSGGSILFVSPELFGDQSAEVAIITGTPYAIGEIMTLSGYHCTPIILGFDINGNINFEDLGTNIISIGLCGTCYASQSWINCDFPSTGYANFNYNIDSDYILASASEGSANGTNKNPISFDDDSYLFTGITLNSIILRTIDFNNDAQYCGDGWGGVSLYIYSLTTISGPGNVVLGITTYTPVTPPTPSVNFDISNVCTYPNSEVGIDSFAGGDVNGLYQISENVYTSKLDAINGTFIDENYSFIYSGLSNGTYYVAIRDKNDISNITVKYITVSC